MPDIRCALRLASTLFGAATHTWQQVRQTPGAPHVSLYPRQSAARPGCSRLASSHVLACRAHRRDARSGRITRQSPSCRNQRV